MLNMSLLTQTVLNMSLLAQTVSNMSLMILISVEHDSVNTEQC